MVKKLLALGLFILTQTSMMHAMQNPYMGKSYYDIYNLNMQSDRYYPNAAKTINNKELSSYYTTFLNKRQNGELQDPETIFGWQRIGYSRTGKYNDTYGFVMISFNPNVRNAIDALLSSFVHPDHPRIPLPKDYVFLYPGYNPTLNQQSGLPVTNIKTGQQVQLTFDPQKNQYIVPQSGQQQNIPPQTGQYPAQPAPAPYISPQTGQSQIPAPYMPTPQTGQYPAQPTPAPYVSPQTGQSQIPAPYMPTPQAGQYYVQPTPAPYTPTPQTGQQFSQSPLDDQRIFTVIGSDSFGKPIGWLRVPADGQKILQPNYILIRRHGNKLVEFVSGELTNPNNADSFNFNKLISLPRGLWHWKNPTNPQYGHIRIVPNGAAFIFDKNKGQWQKSYNKEAYKGSNFTFPNQATANMFD